MQIKTITETPFFHQLERIGKNPKLWGCIRLVTVCGNGPCQTLWKMHLSLLAVFASGNFPTSYMRNDISVRSFTAVPFGIAKEWKQLKYPLKGSIRLYSGVPCNIKRNEHTCHTDVVSEDSKCRTGCTGCCLLGGKGRNASRIPATVIA